jgi:TonB family protein
MRALSLVLLSCLVLSGAPRAQVPSRDQVPPEVVAARREAALKAQISAQGVTVERALELATLQERRGGTRDAEQTLLDARKLFPDDAATIRALAGFYSRQGKPLAAVELIEQLAALQPGDRLVHHTVATYYEELVRKGTKLSDADRRAYIEKGIAAADRAIALDPEYADALVYKNILLRHLALLETDGPRQRILLSDADSLRVQAIEIGRRRAPNPPSATEGSMPAPPPPPPAPGAPCRPASEVVGQPPVRVGGNIRPPAKTKDARPVYPLEAQTARIQGVVILEITIDTQGRVAQGCVLRSVPLLDEAAVNAVLQWEFTPTLLNGAPVPVVMTVTVNFTLQ